MSRLETYMQPGTQPALHTRKLCSCNAVLALGRTDAVTTDAPVPDTSLFGVILLNSPANTDEDFASYIRLFERHRGRVAPASWAREGEEEAEATPASSRLHEHRPYFICADGAYAALKRYCAKRCIEVVLAAAADAEPPRRRDDGQGNNGGDKRLLFHDSVNSIPVTLLEKIRRRRDAYRHREASASPTTPVEPFVLLPVACQMSTDFMKCVALLQRLWILDVGMPDSLNGVDPLRGFDKEVPLAAQSPDVTSLAFDCVARLPEALSTAEVQAGEDRQEADRCRRLLESITTSAPFTTEQPAQRLETRVLPNIAVLGALGGRIDHEFGVVCCLLCYARVFHIMAMNKYNVLFACWPDGVTQLVLPPSWSSSGPAPRETAAPYMCGIIPFGFVREMETAGLRWNVVKGRPEVYDGYTQTNNYRLAFDGLVSACNTVTSPVVTIDVRPLHCALGPCFPGSAAPMKCSCDPDAPSVNPPTLFTLGLPRVCPDYHEDAPASL
ncbi:thiamine pyrophosphokinase, vitamin B1 binding domain family protein [Leishmania donovani]|uniref:Thiamine pyrophosphokinase, vitamin B1 binding domain family protein n=1 Tax=Leishmania donovani TaxID=5661 RepID=A0A504XJS8_LEIDO|nr:thiamine pyrophosphokinase, vitamin B1 binding domain family protein [Leishmania donovani]